MNMVSIDPGAVHCGIAVWQDKELIHAYERTPLELINLMTTTKGSGVVVIIESFSLASPKFDKGKAKDAVKTLELIGMVRGVAYVNGVSIVKQMPVLRHIAMRGGDWRRLKMSSNWGPKLRNDHVASAVAHGLYFLHFNPANEGTR